jgi:hypothetical protein
MVNITTLTEKILEHIVHYNWYSKKYVSQNNPVVIGGCARSGTSLLRVMVDSHPNIYCGPETGLLYLKTLSSKKIYGLSQKFDIPGKQIRRLKEQTSSYIQFIESFFTLLRELAGKPRWGDKSPANVLHLDRIFRYFPNSQFIHMIRDGRDTACSLKTFPRYKMLSGKRVERDTNNPLDQCIRRWVSNVREGIRWRGDPRYIEVKYEDLIQNDEKTLRKVFNFLNEPWEQQVIKYYEDSHDEEKMIQNPGASKPIYKTAQNRWKKEFTSEDKKLFKKLAGDLLIELKYEENKDW